MSSLYSSVHTIGDGWYYLAISVCAALGTYRVLSHVYEQSEYDARKLMSSINASAQYQGGSNQRARRNWGQRHLNLRGILGDLSTGFQPSGSHGNHKGDRPGGEWSTTEELVVQSMGSLSKLALHSDFKIRVASSELLFDFVMRKSTLKLILQTASNTDENMKPERYRALLILLSLVQSPSRVVRLIRAGAMSILVDGMRHTDNEEVFMYSAAIVASLVSHHDDKIARKCRAKANECGVLEVVYETLMLTARDCGEECPVAFTALDRKGCRRRVGPVMVGMCAAIAKTYTQQIDFHERMIHLGYLRALLSAAKQSVANLDLVRTVMEGLVRLCTYINISTIIEIEPDPTAYMAVLMEHGAVSVVTACIRHIEADVSSWGIILLHEFTIRNLGRTEFAETPGIVRWMCRRITTENHDLNQRIFRTLWYLCSAGTAVLSDVAKPANLRRILGAIKTTDDKDLKFWCITLVNRVATQPSSHQCIVESSFLRTFPALIAMDDPDFHSRVLPEIAEMVSRLCNSITLAPLLHSYPIVSNISYQLLKSNSAVAKLSIVVAIIRATSRSRNYLTMFVDSEVINRVVQLVSDFSKDVIQNYSAKCLVALLYSDMVSKETVFFSGLVPYLSRLNHIYWTDVGVFFCKDFSGASYIEERKIFESMATMWPALTLAGIGMSLNTLDNQLESARVLFSAMQLYLAERRDADGHYLSDKKMDLAVNEFLNFQQTLLAQAAMYLMRYFDLWDHAQAFVESNGEQCVHPDVAPAFRRIIRSSCARTHYARASVNTFVMAYYLRTQDDPHFRAAASDNEMLMCRSSKSSSSAIVMRGTNETVEMRWTDTSGAIRRKSKHTQEASSRQGNGDKEPEFTGVLRDARMRCLLPALYLVLDAFADSLDPGMMIQSPVVTRRALWLMRIFYNEFPDLRGLTMRVLANIDLRTLSRTEAAELVGLCGGYVVDTAVSASSLILAVDREDVGAGMTEAIDIVNKTPELQPSTKSLEKRRKSDVEDPCPTSNTMTQPASSSESAELERTEPEIEDSELKTWLGSLAQPGMIALAKLTAQLYFGKHMALHPESIAICGRFYAQYALDRYAAGWRTCEDLYSSIEPQQAVSGHGCWIIDRAGPRGSGQVNSISTRVRHGSTLYGAHADQIRGSQWTDRRSSSSQSLLETSGLPLMPRAASRSRRSLSNSSSGTPSSPFLATIMSDPSIDADGMGESAVSGPATALMVPPGIVYHSYAPYYPTFSALADGCTVWNAGWKLESVRMRTGVDGRLGGVHRFHLRLLSPGLMQIGWCTDQCGFFPESGVGVGDDFESVAYDGYRRRKWFGLSDKSIYGDQWRAGDVVSAELDLDNGRVVFYLNGRSLGLAFGINEEGVVVGSDNGFQGLSRDRTWYPAFSLSYNQGVVFLGSDNNTDQQSCGSIKGGSIDGSDPKDAIDRGDHDNSDNNARKLCVLADQHAGLQTLGVARVLRIRFEFQDLDTVPCIAFPLPGTQGQIVLGPVTDMGNLSTYLQPRWWAAWIRPPPSDGCVLDVRTAAAADLSYLFSQVARPDADPTLGVVRASVLSNIRPASWIYFIVGSGGRVCLATGGDVHTALFDTEAADCHIWLPVVSPAVIRFELAPLYP
ncbi:hypothetical protein EV175_003009 [Coemansia sp. RSA 1933]|nr:hypothetical protein EV175_003009 [Coemansia sp. RSA 1933]